MHHDAGEGYQEFLVALARESGIKTPTREDLAKIDRDRPGKCSNGDWQHPGDTDARITKIEGCRTHLAHKAEHAVHLQTGAVVAVTLQPADRGRHQELGRTVDEALGVSPTLPKILSLPRTSPRGFSPS